jgi:hypothetical protein
MALALPRPHRLLAMHQPHCAGKDRPAVVAPYAGASHQTVCRARLMACLTCRSSTFWPRSVCVRTCPWTLRWTLRTVHAPLWCCRRAAAFSSAPVHAPHPWSFLHALLTAYDMALRAAVRDALVVLGRRRPRPDRHLQAKRTMARMAMGSYGACSHGSGPLHRNLCTWSS